MADIGPPPWSCPQQDAAPPPVGPGGEDEDLRRLCALPVGPPDESRPYRRESFGPPWEDLDQNGCDTRNDILKRDLKAPRLHPADPCLVLSGTLIDPYTGQSIEFTRGPASSGRVQIDHVVALGAAWRSGANLWSDTQRRAYANDPRVLLAVGGQVNQDKGRQQADTWLPPRPGARCPYIRAQIRIKYRWNLRVTEAEKRVMLRYLPRCPGPLEGEPGQAGK